MLRMDRSDSFAVRASVSLDPHGKKANPSPCGATMP
jgi:hypothetical protein